jgi:peroxiredoxin Q/BCP
VGQQGLSVLRPGTPAPDFSARLDDGRQFRATDLRGEKNLVLYFYPKDFSQGCTKQACSFRDSYAAVQAYDAVIIGVSRDSEASHASFKQEHGLSFPLISDADGRLSDLYDVKSLLPIRPRITYVIDKQGIICSAFRHDLAIGRHLGDTLAALEALTAGAA